MTVEVQKRLCPQNHPCPAVRICSEAAITQKGYAAPEIDNNKCIDCGRCTRFCPKSALVLHSKASVH